MKYGKMAARRGILLLLVFILSGLQEVLGILPVRTVEVDIGQNITIACTNQDISPHVGNHTNVMWVREGRKDEQIQRMKIEPNKALELVNVSVEDAGNYFCILDNDADAVKTTINIQVKTAPPALHNVWVKPSTILANILWEVVGTGGHPIIDFTAEYRLKSESGEPEDWKSIMPTHIPPNSRQIDVYHLEPNTTYLFRVWATNKLGRGDIVEVEGHTHHIVEELELAKHLLAGVENFDTRVWVAAVGIVMGTLMVLGLGTCYLLYRECQSPSILEENEVIELVPNIILNPGFFDERTEYIHSDENFSNQSAVRVSSNIILPRRL